MLPDHPDRVLLVFAAAHLALGVAFALGLAFDAAPIQGVHPALKPMKFGLSIAAFLATMSFVTPALSLDAPFARGLAWTLSVTMAIEMVPIAVQALRGTTSHFNTSGVFEAVAWRTMLVAVLVMVAAMIVIAVVAVARPLLAGPDRPMDVLAATAWRAGLWLFLFGAASGFGMGGRGRHSVGGVDGGPGLPIAGWSTRHGDLRVSHFFALHALQVIPLVGWVARGVADRRSARWTVVIAAIGAQALVAVWTLLQAFAGRPFW